TLADSYTGPTDRLQICAVRGPRRPPRPMLLALANGYALSGDGAPLGRTVTLDAHALSRAEIGASAGAIRRAANARCGGQGNAHGAVRLLFLHREAAGIARQARDGPEQIDGDRSDLNIDDIGTHLPGALGQDRALDADRRAGRDRAAIARPWKVGRTLKFGTIVQPHDAAGSFNRVLFDLDRVPSAVAPRGPPAQPRRSRA